MTMVTETFKRKQRYTYMIATHQQLIITSQDNATTQRYYTRAKTTTIIHLRNKDENLAHLDQVRGALCNGQQTCAGNDRRQKQLRSFEASIWKASS